MKKSIIIILAVVAILVIWAVSVYNGLVTMDENVTGQWANVETQYQRRADLIPNLVNTVKGYATHEKETLEGVVAARSQATQIKVDAEDLTPEKLAEYQKAQGAVTSALGKLLAITENYPDLKANQNFLELQVHLPSDEATAAGAERRREEPLRQLPERPRLRTEQGLRIYLRTLAAADLFRGCEVRPVTRAERRPRHGSSPQRRAPQPLPQDDSPLPRPLRQG